MEDTGELLTIHEVEKTKALYDKRHALYKDRLRKSDIWKDIGTETDNLINIIGTRYSVWYDCSILSEFLFSFSFSVLGFVLASSGT